MKNRPELVKSKRPCSILLKIAVIYLVIFSPASMGFTFAADKNSEPEVRYRGIINILPFYMAVNGLRLDYDISLNKNHWIQAGPVLFLAENDKNNYLAGDRYSRHSGAGMHLYHRYYPGEGFGNIPVYISYGGMWHYNHLLYNEKLDGIEYERYSAFQKFGADVIIGLYGVAADRLLIDLYTGMGVRFTTMTSDAEEPSTFNNGFFGPGYSGNILILGIRIGFLMAPSNE